MAISTATIDVIIDGIIIDGIIDGTAMVRWYKTHTMNIRSIYYCHKAFFAFINGIMK